MKHSTVTTSLALVSALTLLAGCADTNTDADLTGDADASVDSITDFDNLLGDIESAADLRQYLTEEGFTVAAGTAQATGIAGASGQVWTVNGGTLEVYEFAMEDAAEEAADMLENDAQSRTDFGANARFYQDDRLIAVYTGTDTGVMDVLEDALNDQFAGAEDEDGIDTEGVLDIDENEDTGIDPDPDANTSPGTTF